MIVKFFHFAVNFLTGKRSAKVTRRETNSLSTQPRSQVKSSGQVGLGNSVGLRADRILLASIDADGIYDQRHIPGNDEFLLGHA